MVEYPRDDEGVIAAFAAATPQEIVAVLDASPGSNLDDRVKNVANLSEQVDEPARTIARNNMRKALAIIAGRSPLSAHRVRHKFGIVLKEDDQLDQNLD